MQIYKAINEWLLNYTPLNNWIYFNATPVITGTVAMGTQFTILIPFTGKYLPYREWKKLDDKTGYYTLSTKDVIVLGDVEENVNPSNIIAIKNDYSPDACDIQSIEQVEQRFSTNYEFRVGGI